MDQNIQSQIDRVKELYGDLEGSCREDIQHQKVSEKTKNLTQEVIVKMRDLLDQALYRFYEKHCLPKLTEKQARKARVYFPVVCKKEDLHAVLGRAQMGNLQKDFPSLYNFLDSVQPYQANFQWLKQVSYFAGQKHIRLTSQIKKTTKRQKVSTKGGGLSVSIPIDDPQVQIRQAPGNAGYIPLLPSNIISIGNTPVKFINGRIVPQAPGLEIENETRVAFLFEGTDINSLGLCKVAVEEGEKLISRLLSFV